MTPVDTIRAGDLPAFEALLAQVDDVNQLDEQGWTLLNWAAGQGRLDMVSRLIARGADVFRRGQDNRTPYLIALAAGHQEVARLLAEAETRAGGDIEATSSRQDTRRSYCKAYRFGLLRAFPGWAAITGKNGATAVPPADQPPQGTAGEARTDADADRGADALTDDDLVFVHQDYSVTLFVRHGHHVLLSAPTMEWQAFCADTLGFRMRTDLER